MREESEVRRRNRGGETKSKRDRARIKGIERGIFEMTVIYSRVTFQFFLVHTLCYSLLLSCCTASLQSTVHRRTS